MANANRCFFPNGITTGDDASPTMVPCDPAAPVSACCAVGHSCTGSGLCYSSSGEIYRGGCTDKTFKDAACPSICAEAGDGINSGESAPVSDDCATCSLVVISTNADYADMEGAQSGFHFLTSCPAAADSSWACATDQCTNSSATFSHQIGPIMQLNITGNIEQASCSSSPSPSPSSVLQPSISPAANCLSSTCHSRSTTTVAVALGVTLGILLLSAISWALWERHKRTRVVAHFAGAGGMVDMSRNGSPTFLVEHNTPPTPLVEIGHHHKVSEMPEG